jgi:metal-responsive CopG/Arc/MetJ family transcriptional regulator
MKTAISIPDPIFAEAETLASRLGISRSELFTRAVKRLLAEHRDRAVTARLDEVYERESSSLEPQLTELQNRALRTSGGEDKW